MGTWIALVGAVLLVVGACMPWMRTLVGAEPRVVTGIQGDADWHELAYAALAFAAAAAVVSAPALAGRRRIDAAAATLVAGLGAGVVAVIARGRVHDTVARLDRLGSPGGLGAVAEAAGGIGALIAGAALVVVGGLAAVGAAAWRSRSAPS